MTNRTRATLSSALALLVLIFCGFPVEAQVAKPTGDPAAGKVLGTATIGGGTDGVAFDDGYAFSANGADGTITMVGETSLGKFSPVATVQTQRGARTIAADQKAHKLYLPAAEYGPAGESKDGKKGRPQPVPDSFQVVVVGR